ncbi:MAG: hypothetical protein HYX79_05800, partial [Chloroflexi bacterium]|nr:hypothetical protein [Chloroflexota bacterium]
ALGRKIRQEKAPELGIATWELVEAAVRAGKVDKALELIEYGRWEDKMMHDSMCSFVEDALAYVADKLGEEEVYNIVRRRYEPRIKSWLAETPGTEESLQRGVEFQRGHGGVTSVTEEPDRYVVVCDPCGSGGQLKRTKQVRTSKKAYPWTWGKVGLPLYCVHCPVMWEILPIETRGYPIRISVCGEKPGDPCIHYYYKKPELIPEEYFTRVGKTKKIK